MYAYVNFQKNNYFLHKICTRSVSPGIGQSVLTMHRLVGGSGQHKKFMPFVGEQPRVNFDRQLKVKR